MNLTSATSTLPPSHASTLAASDERRRDARVRASPLERICLLAVLALSAWMNIYRLSENGYANNFYSAGVKSMLRSLHNFLFVSSDPNGLITIDKPPLSMWLQVASAKVFGFSSTSLLLPEAIAGVLAVLVLYLALARPLGRPAALMAGVALAIFPSFVAVSRDNNPDTLLILLLTLACWLALLAIRSGRLRTLLACAFVVGLAFNTKTLEAYLVVPGIALAYLVCAPGTVVKRVGKLVAAGVLLAIVSLAWIAFVDLTPATHRPWVGSTTNNSELSLTFEYNGFGRLDGQSGGPEEIPEKEGAYVPLSRHASAAAGSGATNPTRSGAAGSGATGSGAAAGSGATSRKRSGATGSAAAGSRPTPAESSYPSLAQAPAVPSFDVAAHAVPPPPPSTVLPDGRDRKPVPFAKAPGALRLFEGALGTQAGWFVPLALLGVLALALMIWRTWADGDLGAPDAASARELGRRGDGRLAALLVFGGWFLIEALFLSVAKGIVHPYYTSEMAPGAAAMVGAGLAALAVLIKRHRGWTGLLALAALATAAAQVRIFDGNNWMQWFGPVLLAATVVAVAAVLVVRARGSAIWLTLAVLCIAPAVYAAATWEAPINGTFPAAGPRAAAGYGGVNAAPEYLPSYRHLLRYLKAHEVNTRFSVLTVSSVVSSPLILMGSDAASLAGYSGTDPAVSARRLAALIKNGEARYVLLGGPYSTRGGNGATQAAAKDCAIVPPSEWGSQRPTEDSFVLLDCAGDEAALASG
jgi:4-amino-4-deoxy-L-arabinose transferase-like glycosyltransferase